MENRHMAHARHSWDHADINQVRDVAWSSLEQLSCNMNMRLADGENPLNYVHRLLKERTAPERRQELRGAAIVCGDMQSERVLFEHSNYVKFSEVDGYDLSEVSLNRYAPHNLKFNPHVVDCNDLILPKDTYDLIVGCHGIHHIYNLGNVFYQMHYAMREGGLLYLHEWVGPEYLQIPRPNSVVSSMLLRLLFPDRKTRTTHLGDIKGRFLQYGPGTFDPSEACNVTELVPQFLKYFRPFRMLMYGGLSYPIFEGIAQNIDQTRRLNRWKISFVDQLEQVLTQRGLIHPLFMTVVAEKRKLVFNDAPAVPEEVRGLGRRLARKAERFFGSLATR